MNAAPPRSDDAAPPTPRGDLALLALTAFWGSTFFIVKGAVAETSPHAFLAARFVVGAVAAALLARRKLAHGPSLRIGALLGVLMYAGFAFQTVGLRLTTSTRSAFITAMSVLLVPPVAVLLFRRTYPRAGYAGIAVATAGLWILTGPFGATPRDVLAGDLLTTGCAVAYAFHIVLAERFGARVHPTAATAAQLAVGAVLALAVTPFEGFALVADGRTVFAVAYTGVLGSALALSIQLWGQARTTAVRAALIFTLEPVFAALFANVFAAEPIGAREIGGGALVIAGVALGQVGPYLAARVRSM